MLCTSTDSIFQAGAPATPEEPDTGPPHGSFTDLRATATGSIPAGTPDIEITLSSGAAGSGVPIDQVLETYSFTYDQDFAACETSIASYKTEASVDGIFPAGASPSTPEELYGLPPRNSFTNSHAAATTSIDESVEDIETTLPTGANGLGVPEGRDDVSEYFPCTDPAASRESIASYKTERTVSSRKSRYSARPRHKYADHGYLRPQRSDSLGDTTVPKVCKSIDPRNTTTTMAALLCRSS